jgi:hypothetical protein
LFIPPINLFEVYRCLVAVVVSSSMEARRF